MKKHLFLKIVSAGILLFALTTCSVWENFTTYFNRYYNASLKFDEAEEKLEEESKQSLFEFREEQPSAATRKLLDEVIEKCSKILQFNQESAFFDKALSMIGKAYYYQGNYTKALRKFQELDALEDSKLKLENSLWVARSLMQMRRFDEGLNLLGSVKELALENEEEELLAGVYLTEIRFFVFREEYDLAIESVKNLFEISPSDEYSAEVAYELGKIYLLQNNLEAAAAAFQSVSEYSPSFDIDFRSRLEFAKVNKELKDTEKSIEVLNSLRAEEKFKDNWDKVDLEIAEVFYLNGSISEALEKLFIIDTTYKKSESSGMANFRMAEIIEKDFQYFDSAKTLYDRVNLSTAPKELKEKARVKAQLLKKRYDFTADIIKNKRQLAYLIDTTLYRSDSAAYFDYFARKDSAENLMKEMKALEGENFDSTKYLFTEKEPFRAQPVMLKISVDSAKTRLAQNKYELGNLYFGDLNVPDSAYVQYIRALRNYSGTGYQAKIMYALGSYYLTVNKQEIADSLFLEIYTEYPEDPIVNAAAEKLGKEIITHSADPAQKKYSEAEKNIFDEKYRNAISAFRGIVHDHPLSPYAAKSLYAIGYLFENKLSMPDSAVSVYDSLLAKYGNSEYAGAVKPRINFYHSYHKAKQDSIKNLEQSRLDSIRLKTEAEAAKADSLLYSDEEVIENAEKQIQNTEKSDSAKTNKPSTLKEKTEELRKAFKDNLPAEYDSTFSLPDSSKKTK